MSTGNSHEDGISAGEASHVGRRASGCRSCQAVEVCYQSEEDDNYGKGKESWPIRGAHRDDGPCHLRPDCRRFVSQRADGRTPKEESSQEDFCASEEGFEASKGEAAIVIA